MYYRKIFYLICFLFLSVNVYAADIAIPRHDDKLFTCREAEMGLKFSCDPDWIVHFDGSADMFVISEEPEVVLVVVKEQTWLRSLEQFTVEKLMVLGSYADGFAVERIEIDGEQALKVKAYDRDHQDVRIADIYMLKDGFLYKFLFSVAPRQEWDRYQFLFKDIIGSLRFLFLTEFSHNL